MMMAEEYLCGSGKSLPAVAAGAGHRSWQLLQWLGVSVAHAALFATMLQLPPPERPAPAQVLQVSLIAPQPMSAASAQPASPAPPQPAPPAPPQPVAPEPPQPTPPAPAARVVEQVAPAPRKPPVKRSPVPERKRTPAPLALTTPRPEPAASPPAPAALPVEQEPAASPAVPASSGGAAAAVAAAASGAPAALVPPEFHADYLDNPAPPYPATSRRRGETGRVLLRVFVSADGHAERVEINASSGFELLDAAAREAVVRWRFVPARRGPEKVAAWVLVPISFVM